LPSIYLALTPRGANKLKNLTEQHIKQLVITLLDQKPIHVAVIFEPITSGVLALFGEFSREEAVQYTRRINDLKMGQK
jgi:preprotein translocase subunit SecD